MAALGPGTVQTLHHRAGATTCAAVIQPRRPPPAAPLDAPRNRPCQVDRVLPSHKSFDQVKTHLQQVASAAALNVRRLGARWEGRAFAPTRSAAFLALAPAA